MFDRPAAERTTMSHEQLAALGGNRVAYIRAIRSEEVAFLCADAPILPAGHCVFVLHAADGTPILLADSREAVMADAASQQIETSACTEKAEDRSRRGSIGLCRVRLVGHPRYAALADGIASTA